jgi:hypothetical protein
MTIRLSTAVRNAQLAALTALIDAGSGPGHVQVFTGTQPAGGPGASATGTMLLDIDFNDPSFAAPSSGSAVGDVTPEPASTGITTGTAGWFRVLDSNDVAVIDGSVTAGELVLSTNSITSGLTVSVTALTLSQPAS